MFVVFGWYPPDNFLFTAPDLLKHSDALERIFYFAHVSLQSACSGKTKIPEGRWFGPRIITETRNGKRVHKKSFSTTPISPRAEMIIVVTTVIAEILIILGAVDYTSEKPRIFHPDLSNDIMTFINHYGEQIRHMLE